jgi:predicted ATP-dependent serine protease
MSEKSTAQPGTQITCPQCGTVNPAWYGSCQKCGTRLSLASANVSLSKKSARGKYGDAQSQKMPVLAYFINLSIYKSRIPGILKGVLILLTGFFAIGAWYLVVGVIIK